MIFEHSSKNKKVLLLISIIILVLGVFVFFYSSVIFYQDKPVFMMTYYGRVSDKTFDNKVIYSFLRKALKLFPEDRPFRGPKILQEEIGGKMMRYENNWQGEIDYFSGEEKIFIDDKEVYEAKYAGGLVDQ